MAESHVQQISQLSVLVLAIVSLLPFRQCSDNLWQGIKAEASSTGGQCWMTRVQPEPVNRGTLLDHTAPHSVCQAGALG